jgi:hypothetical protein
MKGKSEKAVCFGDSVQQLDWTMAAGKVRGHLSPLTGHPFNYELPLGGHWRMLTVIGFFIRSQYNAYNCRNLAEFGLLGSFLKEDCC